ncbi:ATP-binding cassette subfamily B protein [Acetivibrio thermocellus AD2]|jgi:ATP-binding cassette subfamily B multidrug efflux pump|uniref:ATP-binding cassette subfamily B protein n=1 Tax=Acetivibrio thermocellus AD2 TaxID=1138384 RepID=A0AB36TI14_ACETH|nr:ABC transporter ATP-binding protein [Acetivibrio thermocellus]ADU75293.1 ABC transporter transmembrane region [Acetivibrio thermocellus DSM 1313]ALX09282.1 Xenobiotic-transporting ATPase [Acetivibrio thermocellus AD2]ANV77034.1 Xenobiotic-transporting ATPase [Acetivibrio thermocellus DSM 2360]EIC04750.1 ABC transporter related protein [Acetivibrio thermocellus YS]PFH03557.1 ATP-binding cassette subfamily B protein [Acetivibrio thermocellus AD2]
MSRISEERKEILLRRYGNINTTAGPGAMKPGRGKMSGGFGGPGGKRPLGFGGPRGMRGAVGGAKPKNASATINRLLAYIGRDKIKILFVFACVLGSSLASLAGSYILRPVINNLVYSDGTAKEKINNLVIGILTMACIYLAGVVCSYLQQRIMIGVSQNALIRIREELFRKIQKLPLKYHDTHTHGDIMSRFTNDLDAVGEMLNNTMSQIFSGIITLVGTVALMFFTNWILAIIIIVTVPLMVYVGGMIGKQSRKYFIGQQQALGAVNGYIEETVTGQKVIKVFCHEETVVEEFEFLSDNLREKQRKAQFFGSIMAPVMGNLSQISYALSATIGGVLCLTLNFDIGGLAIFTNYSRHFARPISELSMQMNTIYAALAGAERVFEVMDETPEKGDSPDAIEICSEANRVEGAQPIKGEVVLKNVTFGYVPGKTVLKNINVTAKPGQKIAFVGSTGAGKTTVTNLINRFYEIEEGEILIDGINIKNIKKDSLRSNIAMVLQDTHLFSGTVRENIRYGRLDATDEEVVAAAKVACAHSFIERLPQGYDTVLDGDGANLSQGERQLLNIARAAISKAPILILDEATSSVDTRTEKYIERGMDRLMKNRTTFVIAHRLSTVRNADLIIVLEHGEIIEQGTHEELLGMGGRYYQLYTGAVELD